MMKVYYEWRHVFKLDPNKKLSEEALEQICENRCGDHLGERRCDGREHP